MLNRRTLLLSLTSGLVALAVLAAPAIADELFGAITKVDADAKKLTVLEKDTDKEIEVTVTDDTEYVAKKSGKVDFGKLEKNVKKAQDAGKKGFAVEITHEKGVASKIKAVMKKAQ